jgi:hypothetical protein
MARPKKVKEVVEEIVDAAVEEAVEEVVEDIFAEKEEAPKGGQKIGVHPITGEPVYR